MLVSGRPALASGLAGLAARSRARPPCGIRCSAGADRSTGRSAVSPAPKKALSSLPLHTSEACDTLGVLRAALLLAERGSIRGMVLAATLLPQGGAAAGPAVMRYLNRAATLGDPWAALLLAARHWEGGCAGDQQRSHSQATRLVQVAAEAVEAAGERQATVQGTVAAAVAAPERGFLLHCTGGMCQLSPQDTASAAAASLPWPLAARQRLVGQPVLPGAAALLGSYEAVAGSEAGWRDLQAVCRTVVDVVGVEGGLAGWALLELLLQEEQRQAAQRALRLAA